MTCLQRLRHSLACIVQRKWSGEKRQRVAWKGKGKRIPWRAECVQQLVLCILYRLTYGNRGFSDKWYGNSCKTFFLFTGSPLMYVVDVKRARLCALQGCCVCWGICGQVLCDRWCQITCGPSSTPSLESCSPRADLRSSETLVLFSWTWHNGLFFQDDSRCCCISDNK